MSKKQFSKFITRGSNRLIFKIAKQRLKSNELGTYVTYGIRIYQNGILIRQIPDVSPQKKHVMTLIRRCNQEQPDLIHVNDVVADFLQEVAMI